MEILTYKCPCCGGAIEFDSTAQKMICPYCDTEFELETLKSYDEELRKNHGDRMDWDTDGAVRFSYKEDDRTAVYICNSCGGQIVTDAETAATSCPFCSNPVVIMGNLSGDLKPDAVIPFRLDKKAAMSALTKHLTGKHFLPKVFKDENHIKEIKGIYVPFWLYDAHADANVRYKATRVSSWSDSKYHYTRTSYYMVTRGGTLDFQNVPVDGSEKMPNDLMQSIEPYDYSQAVDFNTAYLAGYFANRYDQTSEECQPVANERVTNSTEAAFRNTVTGYASVTTESRAIRLSDTGIRYLLCPVWLLNTTWQGKNYTFAMNGQTGKMVGNLPLDKKAYRLAILAITLGLGAALYGLGLFIGLI